MTSQKPSILDVVTLLAIGDSKVNIGIKLNIMRVRRFRVQFENERDGNNPYPFTVSYKQTNKQGGRARFPGSRISIIFTIGTRNLLFKALKF